MTQNSEKIHKLSWKIFQLLKKRRTDEELNDLLNMTVDELLDEIEQIPNLKNAFTWNDLFELLNHPISLKKQEELYKIKNKKQLTNYVNKNILTQIDTFNFYFKFGMKGDFRNGFQLGDGVFYSLEKIPSKTRKFIRSHMLYENARKHHPTIKDKDWIRLRKRDSYMHISVKAIGKEKAQEKAIVKLRRNHNILKLVVGNNVRSHQHPSTSFFYCLDTTPTHVGLISDEFESKFNIWKPKISNNYIKKINLIFNKRNPTELEQRILNAIDIYGQIEPDTPLNVQFLLCIIGLESLLLGKDDRDYLGVKIAEKISFLLADVKWWQKEIYKIPFHKFSKVNNSFVKKHQYDSRIKMNQKVKEFYGKRSKIAHTGVPSSNKPITEDDYEWASNFLRWSIELVLPMTKKYTHIAKNSNNDTKYLDLHFQKLRFS